LINNLNRTSGDAELARSSPDTALLKAEGGSFFASVLFVSRALGLGCLEVGARMSAPNG
jgi:hypothetical protein